MTWTLSARRRRKSDRCAEYPLGSAKLQPFEAGEARGFGVETPERVAAEQERRGR